MNLLTNFQSVLINNSFSKGMLSFFVLFLMIFYNSNAQATKFDFGSSTSPLETSCIRVHTASAYTTAIGYGFSSTSGLESRDRGGDDLNRDFVFKKNNNPSGTDANWEFKVDVLNGTYNVTLYAGDLIASQNRYYYSVEGTSTDIISGSGKVSSNTTTVVVTDGQINIVTSGTETAKRINGLDITPVTYTFDFGTSSSPVSTGDLQVSPSTSAYSTTQGYGFASTSGLDSRDRASGSDADRDFVFKKNNDPSGTDANWEFKVDVLNGTYDVTLYAGDMIASQNRYYYSVEGTSTEIISSSGTVSSNTTTVVVTDGQINIVTSGTETAKRINRLKVSAVDVIGSVSGSNYVLENEEIKVVFAADGEVSSFKHTAEDDLEMVSQGSKKNFYFLITTEGSTHAFKSLGTPTVSFERNTDSIAELVFDYNNTGIDFDLAVHYVLQDSGSGLYAFVEVENTSGSDADLDEIVHIMRIPSSYTYGKNTDREGLHATPASLSAGTEFMDATYELSDGSIYSKYEWATYTKDDLVHGMMDSSLEKGLWLIAPTDEYLNGASQLKQELTVQTSIESSVVLKHLSSSHYGVGSTTTSSGFKKLYGPYYILANAGTTATMISNADAVADSLKTAAPFDWMDHTLYANAADRGTVTGKITWPGTVDIDSMEVVLSTSATDFYSAGKDYQYYGTTDSSGNYSIEDVRTGTYYLHGWAIGGVTDSYVSSSITVTNTSVTFNDNFNPTEYDHTIFQLGEVDRLAMGLHSNAVREYENREDASDFTNEIGEDLEFTIGTDAVDTDWWYAQRAGAIWEVNFEIDSLPTGDAILEIPIAGADTTPTLDIHVNGTDFNSAHSIDYWSSGLSDSSFRRVSQSSGKYYLYQKTFDTSKLQVGTNTLYIRLAGSTGDVGTEFSDLGNRDFRAVLYDAILLHINESSGSKEIATKAVSSELPNVLVYPNPSSGLFYLTVDADYDQEISITTRSLEGITVDQKSVRVFKGRNRLNQNLSQLSKGLYLVTIQVNASIIHTKIYIN